MVTRAPGFDQERLAGDLAWNDLYLLLAVCRAGSLAGAARALGNNHSTVFRRLNAIESRTGVRFFERLPDGYKMTDAGRAALYYAERVESEMHALSREVLGQDMQLKGRVRVTGPEGFMATIGPELFGEFMRLHPEVSVEGIGLGVALDLSRREADIAIRATSKPPDASMGYRIGKFRFATYASPAYREEIGDTPLEQCRWCVASGYESWAVPLIWKKHEDALAHIGFSSPNYMSIVRAVTAGLGVSIMPCYMADPNPELVRIRPPFERLTLELWLLTHEDLRHTARVKAMLSFLCDELRARRAIFDGTSVVDKASD